MRRTRHRAALLFVLFLPCATGCSAGWHAFDPGEASTPRQLPERQIIEFHADSQVVRVHAVRISQDSLSGIPWLQHTSCDSCRVSYARSRITAVRTGSPGRSAWPLMTPLFLWLGVLLTFAAACGHCMDT